MTSLYASSQAEESDGRLLLVADSLEPPTATEFPGDQPVPEPDPDHDSAIESPMPTVQPIRAQQERRTHLVILIPLSALVVSCFIGCTSCFVRAWLHTRAHGRRGNCCCRPGGVLRCRHHGIARHDTDADGRYFRGHRSHRRGGAGRCSSDHRYHGCGRDDTGKYARGCPSHSGGRTGRYTRVHRPHCCSSRCRYSRGHRPSRGGRCTGRTGRLFRGHRSHCCGRCTGRTGQ